MGYYFPNARTPNELDSSQRERYEALRLLSVKELPPVLRERLGEVKKYVGPIYSGEVMAAYDELFNDAIVSWVLAGENPQNVVWVALTQ